MGYSASGHHHMIIVDKKENKMINTQFLAIHNTDVYSYLLSKMSNIL